MIGLRGLLRRLRDRFRPAPPEPDPVAVTLTVVQDDVLHRVADVTAVKPRSYPAPGIASLVVEGQIRTGEEVCALMRGRFGGADIPPWGDGSNGALRVSVNLARVADCWHMPDYGAVIDRQGQIFRSTIQEALYLTPTLAVLPHVTHPDGEPLFEPPSDIPLIPRATVFMAWGGLHNYGHFLLDCLPALVTVLEAGALDDFPAISPPLLPWHRQLLDLMLDGRPGPTIVEAPVVRLGEAMFSSCMDHFLHNPNAPLDSVRRRILEAIDLTAAPGPSRIYVSRSGDKKRRLVNEKALEKALKARGFAIVRPETLSVAEQVTLFNQADVVVSASGAALANVLFCRPGAKVFELLPTNFTGMWVRNVAQLIDVDYHAFFCPSPLSEKDVYLEGVHRPNFEFVWKLDLAGFLAFLDGAP
ncbi:MAG: capsular polysaccharide biosynthesis protein [Caulobacter sp.]|nr:capsular polysaccharide biosynthesis protein [Caulobacter sp.]